MIGFALDTSLCHTPKSCQAWILLQLMSRHGVGGILDIRREFESVSVFPSVDCRSLSIGLRAGDCNVP
ncbi:hypothetical protein BFJ63_vAg8403 [Fusarium oxysporum f. sp. narcissi]|uniref:Uncharacterized protein n=2 Tax=Fusarium oxysporum TaxID=5507 RepID=A0A4Q2VRB4_FUSOX|nr:hypothetical protein BFJ65_g7249 [Fusarium oxysporum f. sp. cepae]RKK63389.1 hypothetical protein BFJ66_g599 [Fusarium oxysporum f. sp. cepae]RKK64792.1 hypothetical protein BFJ67_g226 [Fusarium oxysporum f. sp. cepae]RYC88818.1 hypothetical protein BFJ63_vAg8403 [Fusarium oxysporum f. sp. narcissi]